MLGPIIAGLFTILTVVTSSSIISDNYFVNENDVSMSKKNYELIKSLGFTEDEISTMKKEKYLKLINMEVVNTEHTETTVSYSENSSFQNSYDDIDNTIFEDVDCSDDELLDMSNFTQEDMDNVLRTRSNEFNDYSIESYDYVSNETEKSYITSDSTKTLSTYASYVKVGNEYKIYIKQNIKWNSVPNERLSDILAINYTNNIRVSEKDMYPDVEMHLKYKKETYSKTGWKHKSPKYKEITKNTSVDLEYTGESKDAYNHKIGDYFAFKFDLPKNTSTNGSSQRYYLISRVKYYDFNASLEVTFDTNNQFLTGTELQSHYVHQTGSGSIDWGKLTFTTTAPYISYSTSFWINDPTFEQALYNRIYLRF